MNTVFSAPVWSQYWAHGDAITHGVAYVLLGMSILSWFFILSKSLAAWRIRHARGSLEAFWRAPNLQDGAQMLRRNDDELIFFPLVEEISKLQQNPPAASLAADLNQADLATRALRNQIEQANLRLERGMTLLASIGATAPFIGLLGTVWGIFHSLSAISSAGGAQIDKLAGPVGEALIMTAVGLLVAIPAVLAYNGLGRANRIIQSELDGFAHDLHAWYLRQTSSPPQAAKEE